MKKALSILALALVALTASAYNLTVGTNEHGTISLKVGATENATTANEGDEVTVTITPDEGWTVGTVTGQWHAAVVNAPRRAIDLLSDFTLSPVADTEDQWTFTMVRANAEISCTYRKLLTNGDITIADIEDVTYTTQPLTPEVTVKDGETVLTEGVDYTVAYSNNVEGGSQGVVTITGIGNYSGTATKNFNVVAAVYSTANAAIDVNVPEGLGQLTLETTGQTTDLYYFLQSYLQNSPNPAYIKLRLASMGQYVISKPLTVSSAITIEGDAEAIATIDATQLGKNPFVRIDNNYTSGILNENGFCTNMYDVTFKNFQLKGLKGQVFYANKQKYLIPYFNVDNCIFRMEGASSKTFFDFNSGGFVEQFTLTNSTLSGDGNTTWSNGGFFSTQGAAKLAEAGASGFKQIIRHNTFYNVAKEKTVSTLVQNSQPWMSFEVMHNVIVNSGKKGQFVKGLNAGQDRSAPNWIVQYNSFLWTKDNENFEDIGASEISGASNCAIAANVEGEIVFANGAEGIAEGDFSLDACPQKEAKIGDPRWLNASLLSKLITPESLDDDNDLAKAINQGVQEGFVKFQLAENQRYTVKQSIVTDKAISITGENVQIDVESGADFIKVANVAGEKAKKADGSDSNYTIVENITLKGLTIKGLTKSLINNTSGNVVFTKISIDDDVIDFSGSSAVFALGNGYPEDLTITKSTLWSQAGHTGFLFQAQGRPKDATGSTSWTIEKSTLYQIAKGKKMNNNNSGIKGQSTTKLTLTESILFETGSNTGNEINGWLFGQNSANPVRTYNKNTYWAGNAEATGWTDSSKTGSDQTGTALTTDPGFKKPAEGDFTLSAYSAQCNEKTGDPRWFAEGGHYNPVTGIETVETEKAEDGAWYTIQGVRVDKPAKGLYIHNGRKVVIK